MTLPKCPRIDLSPGKTHRIDFDSFVHMNLPGKRAEKQRLAFKLIWVAHLISYARYNKKGLRFADYIRFKTDMEKELSLEQNRRVTIDVQETTIKKTLKYMRKAGYLRYSPLEDLWYFSAKAKGALEKLASTTKDLQTPAIDKTDCDRIIHDFKFDL